MQKKIRQSVHQLMEQKGYVSPLDLLLKMEKISPKRVEEWRFGRVPYLERVASGNLAQLYFILTELRNVARELELKESHTAYMSWGKGPKRPLQFSKTGDSQTERRYSTHFLNPQKVRHEL